MIRFTNCAAAALALAAASAAIAAPYSVTYNDATGSSSIPRIVSNSGASVTLVLDNGGASTVSQAWPASSLQCVIHRFNSGAAYIAVNSPAATMDTTTGSFVTNASGVLTAVMDDWSEDSGGIPAGRVATNIKSSAFDSWYVNAANGVVYWDDGGDVSLANVGNESVPAAWSNPVPASGVCASYAYGTATDLPPVAALPVPALDHNALLAMVAMLGLAGLWAGMRRRR